MSILDQVEDLIPKIELEEAGDLEADGNEVLSQNKVRETDDVEVKCDNNNSDMKIAEKASKETAVDEETAAVAMGAATAAATAAGVAAAASTNGNSGAATAAKSTLKYNPIGE